MTRSNTLFVACSLLPYCACLMPANGQQGALAGQTSTPEKSLAVKKALLFFDDFKGQTHDARWHNVVDTFTFENGALKGSQTREKDMPSADGKPVGYLKSAGIGHPTKSKIELGVGGKDGWFEEIKVWNAEPAR